MQLSLDQRQTFYNQFRVFSVLDRVGPSYRPVKEMSAERKARTILVVERDFSDIHYAVLVHEEHEEGGKTYIRGRCEELGVGK